MLTRNAYPAEIARGCVFAESFRSVASVVANGGAISSGVTFCSDGAWFSGSSSNIQYLGAPQMFVSAVWSIVVEFTPYFAANDGSQRYFFNTSANTSFYKHSDNKLYLQCGSGQTTTVNLNDYSPYWKVDRRNVFVIAAYNGSVKIYLNGTLLSNTGNSLLADTISNITIGSSFYGKMRHFKVFKHTASADLLSAQEAIDYSAGSVFNYRNKALIETPFFMGTHDITNVISKDTSQYGRDLLFGNGSTTTTYPTKYQTRGYYYDGGDHMRTNKVVGVGASTVTVAAFVKAKYLGAGSPYLYDCRDSSGSGYTTYSALTGALSTSGDGSPTTYIDGIKTTTMKLRTPEFVCLSGTGVSIPGRLFVGCSYTAGTELIGDFYYFALFPITLTHLQVFDLLIRLRKQLTMV